MSKLMVETTCPICQSNEDIPVDMNEWSKWQGGALIQNAMPDMPAHIREQLISGICPSCWRERFE